ncbi:MAG: SPFH domain-containing protein [Dehalococcoidia bacterium]|nr:SPFH domain-containing protein [Dehalococcoidia bacterium]
MEEKIAWATSGMSVMLLLIIAFIGSAIAIIYGALQENIPLIVTGSIIIVAGGCLLGGLKVLKPKEALVLTLFGKYYGTLKGPGFFFTNPFVTPLIPASADITGGNVGSSEGLEHSRHMTASSKKKELSLKTMTLNNDRQKINDMLGNPIIIGIVVIWRVVNTAKAVFNVDNYMEFLSTQCDSALRNIVRLYPYDVTDDSEQSEKSLRGSSQEIAERLKEEIQSKVDIAGLEIVEARITELAYAPEIAAAMLQRQQATAIVDARQMIVEGAVSMVEMALTKLNEKEIVHLDEERKAAMVSNLLVVLCGSKDAQPVVNSGSLY